MLRAEGGGGWNERRAAVTVFQLRGSSEARGAVWVEQRTNRRTNDYMLERDVQEWDGLGTTLRGMEYEYEIRDGMRRCKCPRNRIQKQGGSWRVRWLPWARGRMIYARCLK
jgi:hypothetical protein